MSRSFIKIKGGNKIQVVTPTSGPKRVNYFDDENNIVAYQEQGEPNVYLVSKDRVTFHCPNSFKKSLEEEEEGDLANEHMLLRMKWEADKITHTTATKFQIIDLAGNPEFFQMMEYVEHTKMHYTRISMDL